VLTVRLAAFDAMGAPHAAGRAAAVAFALVPTAGEEPEAGFLLTMRAPDLSKHAGQWALPGGREDPGESSEEAALRELEEELGVRLGPEAVLGRLDDYVTRSGFVITPVVVWAGDADLDPSPDEVAHVFRVPLGLLDRPDAPRFISIPESERPVVQMPLIGTLVHAPTGAVLYQAREVLLHGRATRVAHLEQPVWAWR
jgi:8-oxo-dGTP pyrophosphatase MutT (NUDIX family)